MTTIKTRLFQALQVCGYTVSTADFSYQLIGQGAWHDAYSIKWFQRTDLPPVVIRLRKQIIYGASEQFDPVALHSDYVPVGLYYRLANLCQPAVCPTIYHYHISPALSCTVESQMGAQLDYTSISQDEARQFGRALGRFFWQMHQQPAPVPGHGEIQWRNNGKLVAEQDLAPAAVWQTHPAPNQLQELTAANLYFDTQLVQRNLDAIWQQSHYAAEPFTLVNRDITPENLMMTNGRFSGVIDPVPIVDNGTKFAAWFLFCYRFLLPVYNPIPRYAHHQFQQYAMTLQAIADGYLQGYVQHTPTLERQLAYAYYLFLLEEAYDCYVALQRPLSSHQKLRQGDEKTINIRLKKCLQELTTMEIA